MQKSTIALSVETKDRLRAQGEKTPYYDENYQEIFKQTIKETKEMRESKRPDLYDKRTKNQALICFM